MRTARMLVTTSFIVAVTALSACSASSPSRVTASPGVSASPGATARPTGTVTVLTHDSLAIPDATVKKFEQASGLTVKFVAAGDGGALVNQLVLTKDAPLADVVYGIDNTFASRVGDAGILLPYASPAPAASSKISAGLPATKGLTAIDFSDVCLNVDLTYFASHDLAAPKTLDDLLDPKYRDMVSVTNPATSSPGLAFLLETVAAKGDGWKDYWTALKANGLRVTSSWSDTYFVDFSAPNYGGDRPIVLSYASSPPSEVIDGKPTTAALLDTCFRQVEYAGILKGTDNVAGAQAVVDWMLSDDFQSEMPNSMYVYPVSDTASIPQEWLDYAPLSPKPWSMSPTEITTRRDDLVKEWTGLVLG